MVRVISNITKEYPDMIRVVVFREPRVFNVETGIKRDKKLVEEDYIPKISSLNRTKTLVKDLVLCNDFELFCTFTFNPEKIDRYNFVSCRRAMRTWIHQTNGQDRHKEYHLHQ